MKEQQAYFSQSPSKDLYGTRYDLVVVGTGYAGYAAAITAADQGKKVLLVSPRCDLLWESSLARHPDSGSWSEDFKPFGYAVSSRTGIAADWIDPGSAEWVANELLLRTSVRRLYHAIPIASDLDRTGAIVRVSFAVREGIRAISAARWVDATEEASLARLCDPSLIPAWPERRLLRLFLQHLRWPAHVPARLPTGSPGAVAYLEPSGWSGECVIRIDLENSCSLPDWMTIRPVLESFRKRMGPAYDDGFVSHWSFMPYPVYEGDRETTPSPAANLALAVPGLATGSFRFLVDRYALGVSAVEESGGEGLASAAKGSVRPRPTPPVPIASIGTDLFVAGLGSAGIMAAVAAARTGIKVMAADAMGSPGGTIESVRSRESGALQREFDRDLEKVAPLFSGRNSSAEAVHPLAHRIVAEAFLASAGVSTLYDAPVVSVHRTGTKIDEVLLATSRGTIRVLSKGWIDATGEGTLCALAGVPSGPRDASGGSPDLCRLEWDSFRYGPDGLFPIRGACDCGPADPGDSEGLTRARIDGIRSFVERSSVRTSNGFNRTTGISPMVSFHRGHVVGTVAEATLDDLALLRRFPDSIGSVDGRRDDPSAPFFIESAPSVFYRWCASEPTGPGACGIPYGAILPLGLDNVWIACRAAGYAPEASEWFRRSRDMRRLGEAAGIAATLALRLGVTNERVPFPLLHGLLFPSTASGGPSDGDPVLTEPASGESAARWIELLRGDLPGLALWRLYRLGAPSGEKSLARSVRPLLESEKGTESWYAALLLGAWGEGAARPRLLRSIRDREEEPVSAGSAFPRSLAAIWALGRCGVSADHAVLAEYAMDRTVKPIARLAAVWSCADIALRTKAPAGKDAGLLLRMLEDLPACELPGGPCLRRHVAERLRKALGLPVGEAH